MFRSNQVPALALMVSLFAAGCAVNVGEDTAASTEDALGTLATSEVVGELKESWYAEEAEAPVDGDAEKYRAFKFDAYEGRKLTAYVVANNDADPVAYILDSTFRMLKRNDDLNPMVKDASIAFTPPETGTYYLAFKTKDRAPARIMARIVEDEVAGPRTKTFKDGWPLRARRSGESEYSYERTKHEVSVSANVRQGAISITNRDGCPADPFEPGAGLTVSDGVSIKVDPVAGSVSLEGGLVSGSASIAEDGTFEIDSGLDRWGFKRATGRIAAGGFVILTHAETMECHHNYAGNTVHGALGLDDAIGAADPNYR